MIRAALDRRAASSFHGEHFDYDDVAFYSGTEMGPLMPVQSPPPIWVVSNPRLRRRRLGRDDGAARSSPPAGASSATATAG